mmetsp:Transcript_19425/g.45167  ORF Transcript_19425/g.45167 Transcript_19425/m.45167 type:complete len:99 (-) Transcript_19425:231-527(-)
MSFASGVVTSAARSIAHEVARASGAAAGTVLAVGSVAGMAAVATGMATNQALELPVRRLQSYIVDIEALQGQAAALISAQPPRQNLLPGRSQSDVTDE